MIVGWAAGGPADSPQNDVADFVDYAKKNPGQLTIASGGVGSSQHLAGASFMQKTGIDLLHVPFKSTAPAFTDLMAGRVDSIITTGALTPVSSGKVKPLAITAKERLAALPDVPTFEEAGVPDFYMSSWYGLVAPKGTPDEVLNRLNEALTKSLENPKIQEDFVRLGAVPAEPMAKEEFWAMVGEGMSQAKELVELSGAREQR
ncbi:tripartite tricarboxylate transporter substrate binding protein [Orrella sp. 11846]|uniref:tripartite tricarboxylate transporter substrate binding protein n=1 Tax=Orrella sp. 11846 TaxID=3409913 RepID=UPI003B58B8C4